MLTVTNLRVACLAQDTTTKRWCGIQRGVRMSSWTAGKVVSRYSLRLARHCQLRNMVGSATLPAPHWQTTYEQYKQYEQCRYGTYFRNVSIHKYANIHDMPPPLVHASPRACKETRKSSQTGHEASSTIDTSKWKQRNSWGTYSKSRPGTSHRRICATSSSSLKKTQLRMELQRATATIHIQMRSVPIQICRVSTCEVSEQGGLSTMHNAYKRASVNNM